VELSRLTGSGPGGRIIRADVEAAPASGAASSQPARTAPAIRPVAGPDDQRIPLTGMRSIIAERLFASKTQIPHFYLQMEIDAAPLMSFRANINEQSLKTSGNKYTVNDFILKAVVRAALAIPAVNSSFDGDSIVQFKSVNLNVAISLPEGLVTPVIKAAETKTVLEISQAVKDLATRAKNKKLSPDEFTGGTITVSNLGASGIDHFAAIINHQRRQHSPDPGRERQKRNCRRPENVARPQRRPPRRRRSRRRTIPRRDEKAPGESGTDAGLVFRCSPTRCPRYAAPLHRSL
jgi:pyruvate dehydrogenase E2 component (dihydrolipoamide acetyltransferase)